MSNSSTQYPCPNCKKPTVFNSENPYRPFCCERCKLIDLGAWASETYRVESKEKPETSDSSDSSNEE
jgi:endogenous inhibitor of DNA gyrase (YacG/DUF329 family)